MDHLFVERAWLVAGRIDRDEWAVLSVNLVLLSLSCVWPCYILEHEVFSMRRH